MGRGIATGGDVVGVVTSAMVGAGGAAGEPVATLVGGVVGRGVSVLGVAARCTAEGCWVVPPSAKPGAG